MFFAALAAFQFLWAAVLVRGDGAPPRIGLLVNAATIVIWAWSRSIGLPIGAEPGPAEPVRYVDVLATAFEVAVVAVVAVMLLEERGRVSRSLLRASEMDAFIGSGLAISTVAIFTLVALVAGQAR